MTRVLPGEEAVDRYSAQTQKLYRYSSVSEEGHQQPIKGHTAWEPDIGSVSRGSQAGTCFGWRSANWLPSVYAPCLLSTDSAPHSSTPASRNADLGEWLFAESPEWKR